MKLSDQNGFISIIALGIFVLLGIFGVIIQMSVINTVDNVKNSRDFYSAQDLTDSAIEYLQSKLAAAEAPSNLAISFCVFSQNSGGDLEVDDETPSESLDPCKSLLESIMVNYSAGSANVGISVPERVEISIEMKSYAGNDEYLRSGECYAGTGFPSTRLQDSECNIIPFPGTGAAGNDCDAYNPFNGETTVDGNVDHILHPCNWNKLEFGSNLTDRVTVPLFYDGIEPFFGVSSFDLDFALRMRTPCTCINDGCTDLEMTNCIRRFVIENTDDVLVKWQFSGLLDGDYRTFGPVEISEIKAVDINQGENDIVLFKEAQVSKELYTNEIKDFLPHFSQPTFTIFLIHELTDNNNGNIPYLEYQIVTDRPIADAKTIIDVSVNIDGNVYQKTIQKDYKKSIVDFAVQN